ncbi:YbaK/EbsC family protein [Chromobacterium sp. TRC.1.1.SA]|uniref:YbaK/EbsC family protein n=1 Tax=Chromobacterium indicum TaxID=3110228 RepID=A0ABV0CI37_9NEIS|nr:YbaK/EbsC family protein [Chromobacterium vaccinii]
MTEWNPEAFAALVSRHGGEVLEHDKPLRSAREGAALFGIAMAQTAPTLIVEADGDIFACILSGGRDGVDWDRLARLLGRGHARLADRRRVRDITGCDAGAVPLLGLDLPCVMDRLLLAHDFVYGGAGDPLRTLKISPRVLAELNRVSIWYE